MKEKKYFEYKTKGHTMLNCTEKANVSTIIDTLDVNIKNVDKRKK